MLKKKINGIVISMNSLREIPLYQEWHRENYETDYESKHYISKLEYCYCCRQLEVEYEYNQKQNRFVFDKVYLPKQLEIGDVIKLIYDKRNNTIELIF